MLQNGKTSSNLSTTLRLLNSLPIEGIKLSVLPIARTETAQARTRATARNDHDIIIYPHISPNLPFTLTSHQNKKGRGQHFVISSIKKTLFSKFGSPDIQLYDVLDTAHAELETTGLSANNVLKILSKRNRPCTLRFSRTPGQTSNTLNALTSKITSTNSPTDQLTKTTKPTLTALSQTKLPTAPAASNPPLPSNPAYVHPLPSNPVFQASITEAHDFVAATVENGRSNLPYVKETFVSRSSNGSDKKK